MGTKTLITADELERMPDDDSVQIELDEGELIIMPPAGLDHGWTEGDIYSLLSRFVDDRKLGRVFTGDTGFRLTPLTVRAPDVSFIRRERLDALRSEGFAKGAPDLAVEIVSPHESAAQRARKIQQYLAAGCHTVWVVHRKRKEVEVYEANGSVRTLHVQDTLEAPGLLPGFSIKVAKLFE